MSEWQDIKTCPANVNVLFFNGTEVVPGQKKQYDVGPFKASIMNPVDQPRRTITDYQDFTCADRDSGYSDVYPEPTHWCALPVPPYIETTIDGEASEVIDLKAIPYEAA